MDLIVGAETQPAPETQEGNAFVYLGSAAGFAELPSFIFDNPGDQAQGHFGTFVALGDLNGDGFDDIVVGALRQDQPEHDEGGAFVYLGTAAGPGLTPSVMFDNPADDADGFFGHGGTSSDVDGDGYADLVIGGARQRVSGVTGGAAYVYIGRAVGVQDPPTMTLEAPDPQANGWFGGAIGG